MVGWFWYLWLRREIDRGAEAAVHEERHRIVRVRDLPGPIGPAKNEGLAVPEPDLVTRARGACHQVEAVADAEIAAHGDG